MKKHYELIIVSLWFSIDYYFTSELLVIREDLYLCHRYGKQDFKFVPYF